MPLDRMKPWNDRFIGQKKKLKMQERNKDRYSLRMVNINEDCKWQTWKKHYASVSSSVWRAIDNKKGEKIAANDNDSVRGVSFCCKSTICNRYKKTYNAD